MEVKFEHDYQMKVMHQGFAAPTKLATKSDVVKWRQQWMTALATWHSPYKCVVDCSNLEIIDSDEVKAELDSLVKFFQGFFLRKVVGSGLDPNKGHELLPFEVYGSEAEASQAAGIRERKKAAPGDFRSQIQFENHFRQHAMELSFAGAVKIDSSEKIATLKSKLMNNLMQWHSAWNLIVDCTNAEFSDEIHEEFKAMAQLMKGFFLKEVVGYSPAGPKESYPFRVYRSRHKAVAQLESEGAFSGDEANCRSRSPG